MGELYDPYPRLPKNIRQIGDRDDVVKLYVEDYVNTYLKRLFPAGGQDLRIGLLLGTSETYEGVPYLFVDGAMEMEDVVSSGERIVFSEASWKKAYQRMEETFPKRTVQGWFICGAPGCILSPLNYWRQHNQYFGGKNQLMYLNSGVDGDEALYITSEDGFYRLKGYSIYYERNQMMQDYMILRKDAHRVESGAGDRVIRDFRSRMEGRKQEAVSRHSTIRTLSALCGMLSIAVLAGGVVMFNNYQKMKEMESVLVSVLPSGVRGMASQTGTGEGLVVEEIEGSVYPVETDDAGGSAAGILPGGETVAPQEIPQADSGDLELSGTEAEEAGSFDSGNAVLQSVEARSEAEAETAESEDNDSQESEPQILPEPEVQRDMDMSQNTGTGGNSTAEKDYPVTDMKPGELYEIGDGETLFGICFKLYGNLDYLDDIRALNKLDDADRIMAGQTLILPDTSGSETQ